MGEQGTSLLERIRRHAMPQGEVEHRGTRVRQRGEMRFAPDKPWLPFEAEQTFAARGIEFRWQARVRMVPLVRARVVDAFDAGAGMLEARVFGVLPIVFARGPLTDKGEALRGLAELPWHPLAFSGGRALTFEEVAPDRLRGAFDDGKTQASLDYEVDGGGAILGVMAASRPRLVGKEVVHNAWSGKFDEYRTFDGIRVPTVAQVTWHLPDGEFPYWRGRVTDFTVVR